jgi:hypothetical protein
MNGGRTIKSEAFFWANSPSEANAYAVEYWKRFDGTMDPYSSQNVDGKQTKDGFCHESFGIYGHGSVSMNIMVSNVDGPSGGWGVMVLKRVLKSRGLVATGGKADLARRLTNYVDKSWTRPLYEHEKAAAAAKKEAAAAVAKTAAAATAAAAAAKETETAGSPADSGSKKRSAESELTPEDDAKRTAV